jgi:hypothetical protein
LSGIKIKENETISGIKIPLPPKRELNFSSGWKMKIKEGRLQRIKVMLPVTGFRLPGSNAESKINSKHTEIIDPVTGTW